MEMPHGPHTLRIWISLMPFLNHTPGQKRRVWGPAFQQRPRLRPLIHRYPLPYSPMSRYTSPVCSSSNLPCRVTGQSYTMQSTFSICLKFFINSNSIGNLQCFHFRFSRSPPKQYNPFLSVSIFLSKFMWPEASTRTLSLSPFLARSSFLMVNPWLVSLVRSSTWITVSPRYTTAKSWTTILMQIFLSTLGSVVSYRTIPWLNICSSFDSNTQGTGPQMHWQQGILSRSLAYFVTLISSIVIIGNGLGISGTTHLTFSLSIFLKDIYFSVAAPCSLIGASQSQEVMAPQQSFDFILRPFAPAVSPKFVPPWAMYIAKELPFQTKNLKLLVTFSMPLPFHPSVQWVIHPVQTSPPKMAPFFQKNLTCISWSRLSKWLMPILAPSQWHLVMKSDQSTQYSFVFMPSSFHIARIACMQLLSVPQNPYQFSICSITMQPLGFFSLRRYLFIMGTRAWNQTRVSSKNLSLLALMTSPSIESSLAGMPPKSHSAHTQGPGRKSTTISYFSARSRKCGKFLLSVSKSKIPRDSSWQFQMMYTLRAFRPIALIIWIRCYQYSTGMREQWIYPAQILPSPGTSFSVFSFISYPIKYKQSIFRIFRTYNSNRMLIWQLHYMHSLLGVLKPDTLVGGGVRECDLAPAMPLALEELPLVHVAILHVLLALALLQVVHELPLVGVASVRHHLALPARPVVNELPLVHIPIREDELAVPAHLVCHEGALVHVLVRPHVLPLALHHPLVHLPLVNVPVFKEVFPYAVLFSVRGLTLIHAVIVFNVLFQELQRVGNNFLAKNFLRQVFQLPKNNLEGPVSYSFGWNQWELAAFQQDIQFLAGQQPILIFLKLLKCLDGLVNIPLPVDYVLHNFLRSLDIVGIEVDFPQWLNIVLPFLNQQPVSGFGVVLQLIDGLVDFLPQLLAYSFDQLIQLYQVVVFAEPLLYGKMFGLSRPVVHLPQISFLQLFQCYQVEFAFLVTELSQAHRAQQRALLALGVQAHYLYFFLFVLLVHAVQL